MAGTTESHIHLGRLLSQFLLRVGAGYEVDCTWETVCGWGVWKQRFG